MIRSALICNVYWHRPAQRAHSWAGKITLDGYDDQHRLGIAFENLHFDMPGAIQWLVSHTDLVRNDKGDPNTCADKFVPLPQ